MNLYMLFTDFIIIRKIQNTPDTFILQVKPKKIVPITPFAPGQYIKMKNPKDAKPDEEHAFSIASSSNNTAYLEFYIRAYGDWTKKFMQQHIGDIVQIAGPFGDFIWDNTTDRNAAFLVGGVGISPIISMLRFINEEKYQGNYTLIYGNRTPQTIAYKDELEHLEKELEKLRIVHIFSELKQDDPWKGYRGFVTKEVLEKEIDFLSKPTFFIIGPPIFIHKMTDLLKACNVPTKKIKKELIA